jgi:hypothetical protein
MSFLSKLGGYWQNISGTISERMVLRNYDVA